MPTGYTDKIGKGISFEDFVMTCARAFGALISMRDNSLDTPIPEEFKVSDYHLKSLDEARVELKKIQSMSEQACAVEIEKERTAVLKSTQKRIEETNILKRKYLEMLSKVKAWIPPSPEHYNLKEFMIRQINESIEFDCSTTYLCKEANDLPIDSGSWRKKKIDSLLYDIDYHTKKHTEEIDRINGQNLWIKQLKESLKKARRINGNNSKQGKSRL